MYRWKLEYTLKNGVKLNGMYEGPENNSDAVLNKLFTGRMNSFVPTYGETDQEVLAVMLGEVAAIRVYK